MEDEDEPNFRFNRWGSTLHRGSTVHLLPFIQPSVHPTGRVLKVLGTSIRSIIYYSALSPSIYYSVRFQGAGQPHQCWSHGHINAGHIHALSPSHWACFQRAGSKVSCLQCFFPRHSVGRIPSPYPPSSFFYTQLPLFISNNTSASRAAERSWGWVASCHPAPLLDLNIQSFALSFLKNAFRLLGVLEGGWWWRPPAVACARACGHV